MTLSLSELIAQREALERRIQEAQRESKSSAIAEIRALMATHGLSAADLTRATPSKASTRAGEKVQPKFRDPESGATWSGRGLKPRWLTAALQGGKSLQDFAI